MICGALSLSYRVAYLISAPPREVQLPDTSAPVGTLVKPREPLVIPQKVSVTSNPNVAAASSKKLDKQETESDLHVASLTSPPDLSGVLYRETYDEFLQRKDPVVLKSHCWTPHQSVYIGCADGQLLLADFEGGVVKVLANPQAIQVHDLTSICVRHFVVSDAIDDSWLICCIEQRAGGVIIAFSCS